MSSPYDIAHQLLGMGETPDREALREFMTNGGQNLDPVTTAWCAAFVNASLEQGGMEGTGKLNARSFLDWGQPVDQPEQGDVAVFGRGDGGWQGHVGFFDGYNPDGTIRVLGGNQGDKVSIANYSADKLLGFRRPDGQGTDFNPNADRINALSDKMAERASASTALNDYQPKALGAVIPELAIRRRTFG
jgi:uncharacterized protein (TIGR02594 family)